MMPGKKGTIAAPTSCHFFPGMILFGTALSWGASSPGRPVLTGFSPFLLQTLVPIFALDLCGRHRKKNQENEERKIVQIYPWEKEGKKGCPVPFPVAGKISLLPQNMGGKDAHARQSAQKEVCEEKVDSPTFVFLFRKIGEMKSRHL